MAGAPNTTYNGTYSPNEVIITPRDADGFNAAPYCTVLAKVKLAGIDHEIRTYWTPSPERKVLFVSVVSSDLRWIVSETSQPFTGSKTATVNTASGVRSISYDIQLPATVSSGLQGTGVLKGSLILPAAPASNAGC